MSAARGKVRVQFTTQLHLHLIQQSHAKSIGLSWSTWAHTRLRDATIREIGLQKSHELGLN
jgi:hypothetical protein